MIVLNSPAHGYRDSCTVEIIRFVGEQCAAAGGNDMQRRPQMIKNYSDTKLSTRVIN